MLVSFYESLECVFRWKTFLSFETIKDFAVVSDYFSLNTIGKVDREEGRGYVEGIENHTNIIEFYDKCYSSIVIEQNPIFYCSCNYKVCFFFLRNIIKPIPQNHLVLYLWTKEGRWKIIIWMLSKQLLRQCSIEHKCLVLDTNQSYVWKCSPLGSPHIHQSHGIFQSLQPWPRTG